MFKKMKQNLEDCNNLFYKLVLKENDTPKNRKTFNIMAAILIIFFGSFKK